MIALHHAISIYSCLTSWPPSLDKSTSSIEMRTKNAFLFSKDQLDLVYLCWNLFAYIMKHINQTYYVMSIPSKYLNINVLVLLKYLFREEGCLHPAHLLKEDIAELPSSQLLELFHHKHGTLLLPIQLYILLGIISSE